LGLIALTLIPRLIGVDRFATVDEPYWLTAGANFYYALGQRDFAATVYDYHPAVTTMWIIAAAMLVYFPQYRGLGQGYFDVYKDSLEQFLLAHDRTPLGLLATARVLQVLVIVMLLVALFLLLRRLFNERLALAAVLLVSFDPFFLGHSRLLNHEAMMTLLVLVAILCLVVHLFSRRSVSLLVVSGAAAGLAQLTKSSAIIMVPAAALLFLAAAWYGSRQGQRARPGVLVKDLAVWLGTLAVVYFVLWPGMWVAPATMLREVFGNAFSYALEGARLSAVGAEPPVEFQPRLTDIALYVQSMQWRTTPIAWIGMILAVPAMFRREPVQRLGLLSVLVVGVLFIVLFGVASGRNSAHYVLTSYAALDILAAAGIVIGAEWLGARTNAAAGHWGAVLLVSTAILVQAGSAAPFSPYYYTYYSPIMEAAESGRQNPNFGYGEGLDLAAAYLDQKPEADSAAAMAFYGRGPFSYFFRGTTEPLKTVYAEAENVPQLQEILRKSDYLVIYYALQRGRNSPANLMLALAGSTPEATIWHNGIEYIRIYALRDMPEAFYDQLWP
jgi:4-amino-4-deoxy-L-arabinose transferase-like glycosyltransferase